MLAFLCYRSFDSVCLCSNILLLYDFIRSILGMVRWHVFSSSSLQTFGIPVWTHLDALCHSLGICHCWRNPYSLYTEGTMCICIAGAALKHEIRIQNSDYGIRNQRKTILQMKISRDVVAFKIKCRTEITMNSGLPFWNKNRPPVENFFWNSDSGFRNQYFRVGRLALF